MIFTMKFDILWNNRKRLNWSVKITHFLCWVLFLAKPCYPFEIFLELILISPYGSADSFGDCVSHIVVCAGHSRACLVRIIHYYQGWVTCSEWIRRHFHNAGCFVFLPLLLKSKIWYNPLVLRLSYTLAPFPDLLLLRLLILRAFTSDCYIFGLMCLAQ